jgi:hypothetical protein
MFFTSSFLSDILVFSIIAIYICYVWLEKRKKRWFVFDPLNFFWIGVFVIYVKEIIENYEIYVTWYTEPIVQLTLLWILVGIVFLHFGYNLRLGRNLSRKIPRLPQKLSPKGLRSVAITLIFLGLLGWTKQIVDAGGLMAWAAVPRGGQNWETVSGYVTLMAKLLTVGIGLFVLQVEMYRSRKSLRFFAWILLALQLLFFLYLGSRSRIIAVVIVALMAWSLPRRKNPSLTVLVPLFLILLVVTNFQAQYRGHFKNFSFNFDEINWQEVPERVLPKFLTGQESSRKKVSKGTELSLTMAVVSYVPERVPYALGYEFLQFFTHPIPRALWPGKRYPRSESWTPIHRLAGTSHHWVDYIRVPFLGGPSPGYVASWYYNGGFLGLLVGGILTGIFFRIVRSLYDRSWNNESYLVIYLIMAPIGFGEASSHPFSWLYSMPLILLPLICMFYFTRTQTRRIGISGRPLNDIQVKQKNQIYKQ